MTLALTVLPLGTQHYSWFFTCINSTSHFTDKKTDTQRDVMSLSDEPINEFCSMDTKPRESDSRDRLELSERNIDTEPRPLTYLQSVCMHVNIRLLGCLVLY